MILILFSQTSQAMTPPVVSPPQVEGHMEHRRSRVDRFHDLHAAASRRRDQVGMQVNQESGRPGDREAGGGSIVKSFGGRKESVCKHFLLCMIGVKVVTEKPRISLRDCLGLARSLQKVGNFLVFPFFFFVSGHSKGRDDRRTIVTTKGRTWGNTITTLDCN